MAKKNVLVLFGGCSPEHDVSKESAATVIQSMSADKYTVIPVYITREGKWLLYDGSLDNFKHIAWEKFGTPTVLSPDRVNRGLLRIVGEKVKHIPVDVVFPVLHGENGEDGTVQGLCELAGLPYVGCGVLASAVSVDKAITKILAKQAGIPQADYFVFGENDLADLEAVMKTIRYKIGYPCFVKPAVGGSSIGISKVTGKKTLAEALIHAAQYASRVIVEKAVVGREIECGVLGGLNAVSVSVPGEIVPDGVFYDFDAKYADKQSQTIVPADLPEEIAIQIRQTAALVFKTVQGRGLARIDFFLEDETQSVIFNEINTMPGFTGISMFPKVWEATGLALPDLIDRLIELALL